MRRESLLALVTLAAIIVFGTAGCSQETGPDKVVEEFLGALQSGELERAAGLVEHGELVEPFETEEDERTARLLFSRISYSVGESSIDGDSAVVDAEIIAPDLARIITQTLADLLPLAFTSLYSGDAGVDMESKMQSILEERLSAQDAPMVTSAVKVRLAKSEGAWKILGENEDLFNALTGNIGETMGEMLQQLN